LRVFLTATTLSIGCAAVVLDAPLWVFAGWTARARWVDVYAALGGVLALALFGIAGKLCWKSANWRRSRNTAILAAGLWVIAAVTVCVWVSLVATTSYRTGYFFAYRCFALTSAVAPNIPILLLAIALYYWSLMQLRREKNVEERKKGIQRAQSRGVFRRPTHGQGGPRVRRTVFEGRLAPGTFISAGLCAPVRAVAHLANF
jgi:uncharacterized membrane protein